MVCVGEKTPMGDPLTKDGWITSAVQFFGNLVENEFMNLSEEAQNELCSLMGARPHEECFRLFEEGEGEPQ